MRLTPDIVSDAFSRSVYQLSVNTTFELASKACPVAIVARDRGHFPVGEDELQSLAAAIDLSPAYLNGFLDGWGGKQATSVSGMTGKLTKKGSDLRIEVINGFVDGWGCRRMFGLRTVGYVGGN